jgi:DNA mismatch repair protein MutL
MNASRIHALPLQLANQIAAGEVVERPASVLKELVENSMDAGATQIDIHIEGAGSQLIRITDNGSGIHPEDLALALSRHATSKLSSSEQLSHIASLGFRGEALPSIASVSRLTLTSKQAAQSCGWQLLNEHAEPEPASHPDGTTISVAELFFNLPARRRFLRSDKTELNHLQTTFNRLALSRFDIGFSATFSEQTQIRLPRITDPKLFHQRVAKICGNSFVREACFMEQQFEDIRLHGWVGKRSAHRAQTDVQYFFINGRVIRDRIINHAVRQAYGDALPAGRQPAYVLYLTLPLDRVDVNVHPTKHEVRFRDARLIHGLITRAVEEALAEPETEEAVQDELALTEPANRVNDSAASYRSSSEYTPTRPMRSSAVSPSNHHSHSLTLLHQRYAVLTSPAPELIDLQAADQALRREQFKQALSKGELASRAILVPVQHRLDEQQIDRLKQHQALLARFALVFDCQGNLASLKRMPYLLSQVDLTQLCDAVAATLTAAPTEDTFLAALLDLIPLSPVPSAAQAEQVLQQLDTSDIDQQSFRCKLDPTTLSGLFSV